MEREKKRKRAEKPEAKKNAEDPMKTEEASAAEVSPPPTEEEVEEFFAILRRMRVAVKYFENEAVNNTSKISGSNEPQTSTAPEGGGGVKGGLELDLNAVPEEESGLI